MFNPSTVTLQLGAYVSANEEGLYHHLNFLLCFSIHMTLWVVAIINLEKKQQQKKSKCWQYQIIVDNCFIVDRAMLLTSHWEP